MPAYRYQALDASGRQQDGLLEADSARAARAQLRQRRLRVRHLDRMHPHARRTLAVHADVIEKHATLRHYAEQATGGAEVAPDIVPHNRQRTTVGPRQPRQAGDQRRLAGAVGAKQPEEIALCNVERNP